MPTAKEYFKSMFEDETDCAIFLFKHHTCHVQCQIDAQRMNSMSLMPSGLGRWEVYDKAPGEDGATLASNPMAPDDHRLMPAIVEHYFCNSRHRDPSKPHYFWLHWFLNGAEIASAKVQARPDGTFPVVLYDSKHGVLTNEVTEDELELADTPCKASHLSGLLQLQ